MATTRTKLAHSIADKTLREGSSKEYVREVAAYLLSERKVSDLDSVLRDVQDAWALAGYVNVVAASAHELTDEVKKQIESKVRELYPDAKKIVISEVHDPEVIGGVRLSMANQQLDLSIEAKLNKFKQLVNGGND